jgi:hypothetical protein
LARLGVRIEVTKGLHSPVTLSRAGVTGIYQTYDHFKKVHEAW